MHRRYFSVVAISMIVVSWPLFGAASSELSVRCFKGKQEVACPPAVVRATEQVETSNARSTSRAEPVRQAAVKSSTTNTNPATSTTEAPPWHHQSTFFLRRNMEDFGSFSKPSTLEDAKGAQFTWSRDGVQRNTSWGVEALVAARLLYWEEPSLQFYIPTAMAGAYVQFERLFNSRLSTKDVDVITAGGAGEVAFAPPGGVTYYLRTKGEIVSSFEGSTKNWNLGVDLAAYGNRQMEGPNTLFNYLGTPLRFWWTGPFQLTVLPKLRAEYRGSLDGSKDPIFAEHDHALRVGAIVTANIDGFHVSGLRNPAPWYIRGIHFQTSYGYWFDTVSKNDYWLWDNVLTFNLVESGALGVSASYKRGFLDATGARVEIAKLALAAKFGEAP